MRLSRNFCKNNSNVEKIKIPDGLNVYNIILENEGNVEVNGMECESLKHSNPVAKKIHSRLD